MVDHELLELAAKASGIRIDYSTTNGGGPNNTGFDMLGNAVLDWHNSKIWNPLTDDGDALRLAVKLEMVITIVALGATVDCQDVTRADVNLDAPYAATRRAIVRAAAEIGKTEGEKS